MFGVAVGVEWVCECFVSSPVCIVLLFFLCAFQMNPVCFCVWLHVIVFCLLFCDKGHESQ